MSENSESAETLRSGASSAQRRKLTSKSLVLLAVVLAAVVALLSSVQTWVDIKFFSGVASVESLATTGQDLSPALTLIALAGLASALVLTIAGPVFRRIIGVLIVLLGAGLTAIAVLTLANPLGGARGSIETVTGISGEAQYGLVRATVVTAWPTIAALCGFVLVVAGLWVVIFGARWKSGGRKYESGENTGRSAQRESGRSDRISDWDALSDGDDPTAEP